MTHPIVGVDPDGVAQALGIQAGDALVSINGREVVDWIDYQAFCCAEKMNVVVLRDGEEIEYEFEKDEYEPLGLTFDTRLLSKTRDCVNKCVFCFVDQLPGGVRESLRVKDDDWRLSLMMGNFVTLTNVSDAELTRIIERHASPLYISVHAADGALRAKLLGCPRASKILSQLHRLQTGGVSFHAQAVLCPGLNDGDALENTIAELAALSPACLSLALVPVGLTGHRPAGDTLRLFTRDEAKAVLRTMNKWRARMIKRTGESFVHAADEFYLLAGEPFPEDRAYDGYPQIENGVGLCRLLETEFDEAYREADLSLCKPGRALIAAGVSAAPFLSELLAAHPLPGVDASVIAVENRFFGPTVTVSGLLTGSDLVRALSGQPCDRVLITECMLREGEDVFLDGMTLAQVQDALGVPVEPVARPGDALLRALMNA